MSVIVQMAQPTDLSNMLQVVDKYVLSIGGCHVTIQKALTVDYSR
jgi:hypothetical protein